jgi:hypothetical protein
MIKMTDPGIDWASLGSQALELAGTLYVNGIKKKQDQRTADLVDAQQDFKDEIYNLDVNIQQAQLGRTPQGFDSPDDFLEKAQTYTDELQKRYRQRAESIIGNHKQEDMFGVHDPEFDPTKLDPFERDLTANSRDFLLKAEYDALSAKGKLAEVMVKRAEERRFDEMYNNKALSMEEGTKETSRRFANMYLSVRSDDPQLVTGLIQQLPEDVAKQLQRFQNEDGSYDEAVLGSPLLHVSVSRMLLKYGVPDFLERDILALTRGQLDAGTLASGVVTASLAQLTDIQMKQMDANGNDIIRVGIARNLAIRGMSPMEIARETGRIQDSFIKNLNDNMTRFSNDPSDNKSVAINEYASIFVGEKAGIYRIPKEMQQTIFYDNNFRQMVVQAEALRLANPKMDYREALTTVMGDYSNAGLIPVMGPSGVQTMYLGAELRGRVEDYVRAQREYGTGDLPNGGRFLKLIQNENNVIEYETLTGRDFEKLSIGEQYTTALSQMTLDSIRYSVNITSLEEFDQHIDDMRATIDIHLGEVGESPEITDLVIEAVTGGFPEKGDNLEAFTYDRDAYLRGTILANPNVLAKLMEFGIVTNGDVNVLERVANGQALTPNDRAAYFKMLKQAVDSTKIPAIVGWGLSIVGGMSSLEEARFSEAPPVAISAIPIKVADGYFNILPSPIPISSAFTRR